MQKIRQVLRFRAQGKGTKSIGHLLGMYRNSVKKYFHLVQKMEQSYDELLTLSDPALSCLSQVDDKPVVANQRSVDLEALLPGYCKRLKKVGVTSQLLHKEYLAAHPDGYGRSRGTYTQCHLEHSRPVMHLEHKAGEKIYIDFAGDKRSIVDKDTGELLPVEVFVSILPSSQLTYVEAVWSQKKEDLIYVTENSLLYFESVPKVIVPDNLKSAVTKASKYEATINDDFALFAEYYGCTVILARAYKPKDKALVEGAVILKQN